MMRIFLSFAFAFSLFLSFADSSLADGRGIPFGEENIGLVKIFQLPDSIQTSFGEGEEAIGGALYAIVRIIKAIVGAVAVLMLLWSAVLFVSSGEEEEKIKKAKTMIVWSLLGLVFLLMMDTAILSVFYGGGDLEIASGMQDTAHMEQTVEAGKKLVLDAISWGQAIITIGAVLYLILSGFRLITSMGDGETLGKEKTSFQWLGIGLVVMLINQVLVTEVFYPFVLQDDTVVYTPNAAKGIEQIMIVTKYFLGFLALLVFAAIVYGGAQMIFAFGNEEKAEKGKTLIKGAAIGVVILLMSGVLVATLISGSLGGE